MSVLVYIEKEDSKLKKNAYELATYARKTADEVGGDCHAIIFGEIDNADELGNYGIDQVHKVEGVEDFDSQLFKEAIAQAAETLDCDTVLLAHSANGKSLIGRLAVRMDAGSVSGVNQLPTTDEGFHITKPLFSGKALADYTISTEKRIISLMGNSIRAEKSDGSASIEAIDLDLPEAQTEVISVDTVEGEVPLAEAELVVSAGRGMKGPENWDIIEELADELGAATACSRPVADSGWRPHHEHVGQTGVAIRPNLYLAAGISGAIQHLAGVNNSKTIVVINKDPEAPFFKSADYGVVDDLFDVVPRLTEALKKFNGENNS